MKYLLLVLLFSASNCFSQDSVNSTEVEKLNNQLTELQNQLQFLDESIKSKERHLNIKIDTVSSNLSSQARTLSSLVNAKNEALRNQVTAIYDSLELNTNRLKTSDDLIKSEQEKSQQNFLYTIIGILILLILILAIYLLIQRRAKINELKTKELETKAQEFKAQLSHFSASSSEDLASALENFATLTNNKTATNDATDHSMVIEFAKQIVSMENNMSRMDPEDRGLKRISRAIQNMHNTLKTMDYEITPLLGSEIRIGKIIEIDKQEPDESIVPGKRVIYNVVKAEILYQGEQIQKAKVDIKFNPND